MTDYSKMTDDELSAAVAEKVMGWKREQIEHAHKIAAVCAAFNQSAGNEEAQADLRADLTELDRTATPGRCILMNYAGSWDAAGEVVEKMRENGFFYTIADTAPLRSGRGNRKGKHFVRFFVRRTCKHAVTNDSLPLAITLAALRAVGAIK